MDSSIDPNAAPGGNDTDEMSEDAELCVPVDILAIDGTQPAVGDHVNVKVGAEVTRIVNDSAYIKVLTVDDQPLNGPNLKPSPAVDERDRLKRLSESLGAMD